MRIKKMKNNPPFEYKHDAMSMKQQFFEYFTRVVEPGSIVLEFGSGKGTENLVKLGYNVFSIEEHKHFCGLYHDQYIHAPIVDGWYDKKIVLKAIKKMKYAAIIVDGPAQGDRRKIMEILNKLDNTVPLFIDDIDRKEDQELFALLSGKTRNTYNYGNFGYMT
tara:strand:+ start:211 stop:699 length:489 start_codon:yes stop_codon:yes gene_type:complete